MAGREFAVAASEGAEMHLGGWINSVQKMGDGSSHIVQSRSSWSLTGVAISIDHDRGDLEYLTAAKADASSGLGFKIPNANLLFAGQEAISGLRKFYPCHITLADGSTYSGAGIPVGKVVYSTDGGTARVDFEGDGELSKS